MTDTESLDRNRNYLAAFLVVAFVAMMPALIIWAIPDKNKDIVTYMVGQLSGMVTTALAFYFVNKAGQDAIDAKRADNTGKLADAVVAAANSTPGSSVDTAGAAAGAVADAAADKADEIKDAGGIVPTGTQGA